MQLEQPKSYKSRSLCCSDYDEQFEQRFESSRCHRQSPDITVDLAVTGAFAGWWFGIDSDDSSNSAIVGTLVVWQSRWRRTSTMTVLLVSPSGDSYGGCLVPTYDSERRARIIGGVFGEWSARVRAGLGLACVAPVFALHTPLRQSRPDASRS